MESITISDTMCRFNKKPQLDICIVLARYNENIDWVLLYPTVQFYIINKGDSISRKLHACKNITIHQAENLGREGGSYVDYINLFYNNLPNYILFSQANPFDKIPNFLDIVDLILTKEITISGYLPIGSIILDMDQDWIKNPQHGIENMYKTLFKKPWVGKTAFPYGATMAVEKTRILKRSKKFWEASQKLLNHGNGGSACLSTFNHTKFCDEGWGFEKCWPIIFDGGKTESNI